MTQYITSQYAAYVSAHEEWCAKQQTSYTAHRSKLFMRYIWLTNVFLALTTVACAFFGLRGWAIDWQQVIESDALMIFLCFQCCIIQMVCWISPAQWAVVAAPAGFIASKIIGVYLTTTGLIDTDPHNLDFWTLVFARVTPLLVVQGLLSLARLAVEVYGVYRVGRWVLGTRAPLVILFEHNNVNGSRIDRILARYGTTTSAIRSVLTSRPLLTYVGVLLALIVGEECLHHLYQPTHMHSVILHAMLYLCTSLLRLIDTYTPIVALVQVLMMGSRYGFAHLPSNMQDTLKRMTTIRRANGAVAPMPLAVAAIQRFNTTSACSLTKRKRSSRRSRSMILSLMWYTLTAACLYSSVCWFVLGTTVSPLVASILSASKCVWFAAWTVR
jgi:hypothetical protein